MKEIWKPAYGYDGLYEISNKARVKSLVRINFLGNSKYFNEERILKPYISDTGYYVVRLVDKYGKAKNIKLHRLLMLSFVGPDPERPIVNHLNGNKLDLDLSNLEWSTSRENNIHAIRTGLKTFDFMLHDYRVAIDNLCFNARGAYAVADKLHQEGYFLNVSRDSLKTSVLQCASAHKLYMGKLKVERTDDPFDISSDYVYNRCGIKGREIHALLPNGLEIKAKGPANLSRLLHRLGYFKTYDIKGLTKKVSRAGLNSNVVSGIKFWFVE